MVTITINNSLSQITGLTPADEKKLKAELSYVVGGSSSYYSGYGPRKKSLLDKRGYFPTGLLPRVKRYLSSWSIGMAVIEKRKRPGIGNPFDFKHKDGYKPHDEQLSAMFGALSNHRGIISSPTGTGKSFIIALIASRLGLRTLVVVPSLEIKKQLVEDLGSALMATGLVVVENIDSTRLGKLTDFDVLIIDEAHHVAAKTYHKLNMKAWTGIYYRFFLTATPFRNDTEEQLLFEAIADRVIYQLTFQQAVAAKMIVPVEAYYIDIPKQSTDAHTWQQVYNELVVNNDIRNEIIALTLVRLHSIGVSTLCLVREVKHGQILSDLTGIPFVHGSDDDSRDYIRQFKNGTLKALIGTEGVIGEGVDTKPCEYVIIAGLGKAKSAFMQKVGRTVRNYLKKDSGKVIIFRDTSHKFTLRHFNAQKKIIQDEYKTITMKLEI